MSRSSPRRRSFAGFVPVGFAVLLAAFCAGGTELYISSAGSAATSQQLGEACRSVAALTLPVPTGVVAYDDAVAEVERIGSFIPNVEPARRGGRLRVELPREGGPPARLVVVHLDGLTDGGSPFPELAVGEVALTARNADQLGVKVGDALATRLPPTRVRGEAPRPPVDGPTLTVAHVFDDVPDSPVPPAWCGLADLVEPTAAGDLPPVSGIVSAETFADFGDARLEFVEYRIVDEPITLTDAKETIGAFALAMARWEIVFEQPLDPNLDLPASQVIARADGVAVTVDRSLQPVRITSLVAVGGVLLAAAVLLARGRSRELRLLGVRGVAPVRAAARLLPEAVVTSLAGAMAGLALAWVVVVVFAPSSLLETSAMVRALVAGVAVVVVSVLLVWGAIAVVSAHMVDRSHGRHLVRFLLPIFAVSLAGLSWWSYSRLRDVGGMRTFGVEVRGGELLALGFPLFALLGGTVVVCAGLAPLANLARRTGGRLPRAVRLGWRRVVLEAGPATATVAAVSLAAGSFVAASALSEGADRQLADKAAVYVGADLAFTFFDELVLDPAVAERTTVVVTSRAKRDGDVVDLYGIDPGTFAAVATLRSDASTMSLAELAELLTAPTAGLPSSALAVGGDHAVGDTVSVVPQGAEEAISLEIVATLPFFPGKATGIDEYVVLSSVVEASAPGARSQLIVRDPPPGLVEQQRAAGVRIGVVRDASTTFSASNFSGLRWAYLPLRALGLLFAVVAAATQLLVVSARRTTRRAAHAIQRRTGFGRSSLWVAALTEAAVPLATGAVLGLGLGVAAVRTAIPRLDPMPLLMPVARFQVPWDTVWAVAVAVPLWALVSAALIVRSTTSGDPMQALRGEQ